MLIQAFAFNSLFHIRVNKLQMSLEDGGGWKSAGSAEELLI